MYTLRTPKSALTVGTVAYPESFDADPDPDPDPTFHADADPDPKIF